ncbi:MAG: nucleoside deaminase [Alphaproteobacteria bacterium]|nr:MAG: nucleoside deaminase [Alphaproteobacteria bacterium]
MKEYFDFLIQHIKESALDKEAVPIAALLVYHGRIISHHVNGRDPLEHAEMRVLKEGQEKLGAKLKDAVLYVTLEPCEMCKAAISLSGVKKVYFGAYNDKSVVDKNIAYYGGFCEEKCSALLKDFFKNKRPS